MWDQLDATISDFIANQLFLNMFRASLRPSSGGQTAFSLHMVICPLRLSNITTVTTGQITICSENAVWPPEDGRKDSRNMLNNWLTINSLIVASSWSHIYLLIKDARSFKHKVMYDEFFFSSQFCRASWYFQSLLFTNWCTIDLF